MRLSKARVCKYRSIHDTGWFDVESTKTILVGPNEAGKTALLKALQQLNAPKGVRGFDPLRDYPRSEYNDITTGKVVPKKVTVVEGHFALEPDDQGEIPEEFRNCTYVFGRKLDNLAWHRLDGAPPIPTYAAVTKDLALLSAHVDSRFKTPEGQEPPSQTLGEELEEITSSWIKTTEIRGTCATKLNGWLKKALPYMDESNETEERRYDRVKKIVSTAAIHDRVLKILNRRLPVFVRFSNYFRVRALIHLDHLAHRTEANVLDDKYYDYGNNCLLQLLGFSARELSNLGRAGDPQMGDSEALQRYRDQLDKRSYQLNAASVRLTKEIQRVWVPDRKRAEADRLRISADAQYLKVVVEDDLGVEIELDQRSEGFQWLVSFFIVFFAETADKHENAILLLDEPGLSLHGLKQREFQSTVSRLAKSNQTLYTTHSPFLVGPGELDLVRVLEMTDRNVGTKVHTQVTANDPAALLPLQEALGYDLAQSLFSQQRNLVVEGLTDYWYIESLAEILRAAKLADLDQRIALLPAKSAGKVVYYATILHAHKLKVAALLDSDAAGEQAAQQEILVHTLKNKNILRTRDAYKGAVGKPEIEDMLRETLVEIAKEILGWDVGVTAQAQPSRPLADIFADEIKDFSKYKLAKAFLRWAREHEAADLTENERDQWSRLIDTVNRALK